MPTHGNIKIILKKQAINARIDFERLDAIRLFAGRYRLSRFSSLRLVDIYLYIYIYINIYIYMIKFCRVSVVEVGMPPSRYC